MTAFDVLWPLALLLLPLALLPWLRRREEALTLPTLAWLPADRAGRWLDRLQRLLGTVLLAALVLALAGLGKPQSQVLRTGRGAEVLLLVDRSRSMDLRMLPADWRSIDPIVLPAQARARGPVKSEVARDLLSRFVEGRHNDRIGMMFFSQRPVLVVPFTDHKDAVLAGIRAASIGRGVSDTDVAAALDAAIAEFERRAYSGSRIVLLVSDGGAKLSDRQQARIRNGLARQQVALYWLYMRSYNAPLLDDDSPDNTRLDRPAAAEDGPEAALHAFFRTLRSPYHLYQAEDEAGVQKAMAEVARQQNAPLTYVEDVPREDLRMPCLLVAMACAAVLVALGRWELRAWETA